MFSVQHPLYSIARMSRTFASSIFPLVALLLGFVGPVGVLPATGFANGLEVESGQDSPPCQLQADQRRYSLRQHVSTQIGADGQVPRIAAFTNHYSFAVSGSMESYCVEVLEASVEADEQMRGMVVDISPLQGLVAHLTLDERGEIVSSDGLAGNPTIEALGGVKTFTENLQALFFFRPEESMEEGLSWTRNYQHGGSSSERTVSSRLEYGCGGKAEYPHGKTEQEAWKIQVDESTSLSIPGRDGSGTVQLEGTLTGIQYVDDVDLKVLHRRLDGQLEGSMTTPAGDMELTQTVWNEIRLESPE